jgi:hypothetical protein
MFSVRNVDSGLICGVSLALRWGLTGTARTYISYAYYALAKDLITGEWT